jgi:tetratricopeptide (TPR) repeat protein
MIRRLIIFLILMGSTGSVLADAVAQKKALDAQGQYDAQHYAEAAKGYELVLADKVYSPEIFFNLGNAYFKAGDSARALLNYRRAWYFIPGDPDLRANMQLAAKSAGVTLPVENVPRRLAFAHSQEWWVRMAQVGYLLAMVFAVVAITVARGRAVYVKCAVVSLGIAAVACFSVWQWHGLYGESEQIALKHITAKFGPTDESTDYFTAPAGALVRLHAAPETAWAQIDLNGNIGWVKKVDCSSVVIWKF